MSLNKNVSLVNDNFQSEAISKLKTEVSRQNKMFSNHTREGHRTAVESHENATLSRLQRKPS